MDMATSPANLLTVGSCEETMSSVRLRVSSGADPKAVENLRMEEQEKPEQGGAALHR